MHWHKQSVHPVCAESARDSIRCAATTLLGRESPDWVAARGPALGRRPAGCYDARFWARPDAEQLNESLGIAGRDRLLRALDRDANGETECLPRGRPVQRPQAVDDQQIRSARKPVPLWAALGRGTR
ncbi:hypothetical protein DF3PB_580007 [uncultured Defluviicoccus sp.]|uniref:Uncharacterized protein n=1 Tax=metagenome TaxID=256318 RepID=A0A380TI33_9ZZZZ|nr:hypothetical protein DF3PB_580007 [uncultured Defluviicoccus sp.]